MLVFNQLSFSTVPLLRKNENRVDKLQQANNLPFDPFLRLCPILDNELILWGAFQPPGPAVTWSHVLHGMSKIHVLFPFPGLALRARKAQKVKSQLVTCETQHVM